MEKKCHTNMFNGTKKKHVSRIFPKQNKQTNKRKIIVIRIAKLHTKQKRKEKKRTRYIKQHVIDRWLDETRLFFSVFFTKKTNKQTK